MNNKLYVCVDEYSGSFVGTVVEVLDWQFENDIPLIRCKYYKVSDEITYESFMGKEK